jgi:UDP-N-acetylmuramoyl-tripeptide--D-alanyl-D-alanine ligase
MPELRIEQVVEATGGRLLGGDPRAVVTNFTLDTRKLCPKGCFFAMKGTRTDGHAFLEKAAKEGAGLAVVQEKPAPDRRTPEALILVEDTVEALTACGRYARDQLADTRLISLTGSTGKTTTKELLAAGLAAGRKVHRTDGNYNNHLGVPLTLLACPAGTEIAVVELGMSAQGEIASLTRMTRPDIGLVTNIAPAHLASFSSLDDIAASKGELFALMPRDSVSVVNLDDTNVRVQSMRHDGPRITYGRSSKADVRLEQLEDRLLPGCEANIRIGEERIKLRMRLGGAHSAQNALAALAVVHAAGEDTAAAARAIERMEPGTGRGKVLKLQDDLVVVDDTYNSNPTALISVLETVRNTTVPGRKILVMGDMLELGRQSKTFHHEAGRKAAAAGVNLLVGVGPMSRAALESGRRSGIPEVHHETDSDKAAGWVVDKVRPGDLVLVKGSRGIRLELVVQALVEAKGGRD